jgi:putative two-component system response regulator
VTEPPPSTELLIVDDEEPLRRWEERVMRDQGYSCDGAGDAKAVRERLSQGSYQLALLDVNIPGESGIELLSYIRRDHPEVAVLMVTGEDSTALAMTAIEQGAYGYLIKPVAAGELLINVATALHRRRGELQSRRLMQRLRASVEERDGKLEEALQDLELSETKVWVSQAETIFRLARMVEFRDEETGHHLNRMSSYCEILARKTGLSEQECERIRLASQLHDVGKVAIPDSILLKRGKLTPEEFEVIKGHSEKGFQMLSGSASEVVQMGALIARTHHERWDGKGYPRGLAGEEIPLEGRIAALADVFDALTSDRVYRSALPVKSAVEMMREERGTHFDPELSDAFFDVLPEVEAVRQAYAD